MNTQLLESPAIPHHQQEMVDNLTAMFRERVIQEITKQRNPICSLDEALVAVDQEKLDILRARYQHVPSKARAEHFDLLVKVGLGYVDCQLMCVSYD